MLKLLSEFLYSPSDFFQHESRQRIVINSVFGLLIVCSLLSMPMDAVRRSNASGPPAASATPVAPTSTQTKWWVKHERSETPTSSLPSLPALLVDTGTSIPLNNCPTYATDFRPGTFGYISLFPPYENLVRSGAGTNYSTIGFIAVGDWVKILAAPVCADDSYVWLNVESRAGSSNWTAGGHKAAQWVIPCPDPKQQCSKIKPTRSASATPNPSDKSNNSGSNNAKACVSDRLAVGLDVQVSPNDLLVVRSEPLTGAVLGHIAPLTVINTIDGPKCAGDAVWWKVSGPQTGWAIENNLRACPKERECDAWKDEQLQR